MCSVREVPKLSLVYEIKFINTDSYLPTRFGSVKRIAT